MADKSRKSHLYFPISKDVLISKILPLAGGSCDMLTSDGTHCSKAWEFKSAVGRNTDCKKYCIDHCDKWLEDFLFDERYKIENDVEFVMMPTIILEDIDEKSINALVKKDKKSSLPKSLKIKGSSSINFRSIEITEQDVNSTLDIKFVDYEISKILPVVCNIIKHSTITQIYTDIEFPSNPDSKPIIYNIRSGKESKGWWIKQFTQEKFIVSKNLYVNTEKMLTRLPTL